MYTIIDWNLAKADANRQKHGVSFEEASSVFHDEYATQFFDERNSGHEERFILLGMSNRFRILVVCHCERANGKRIRIFSARKATSAERRFYKGLM